MDMMHDALKRRRGKGMELQILLDGQPIVEGQAEMTKDPDLAPSPEEVESPMKAEAPEALESEEGGAQVAAVAEPSEGPTGGKPRSLGERARMMAVSKGKK